MIFVDERKMAIYRLERKMKKWNYQETNPINDRCIPINGDENFSEPFVNSLGETNTTNIYCLDENLFRNVVAALAECEAYIQAKSQARYEEYGRTNINNVKFDIAYLRLICPSDYRLLVPDAFPRWGMCDRNKIIGGWRSILQKNVFPDLYLWDVVASLANILGMDINNIENPRRDHTAKRCILRFPSSIPEVLPLPHLLAGADVAKLDYIEDIRNSGNKIIGSIAQYRTNMNKFFCLQASVGYGGLSIGINRPKACFLSQRDIVDNSGGTILFFQDMRSAIYMKNLLSKIGESYKKELIVTSILGKKIENFPWDFLYGRRVMFIPAPSKVSLSRVRLYKEYITGAHAASFRVYPGFLLFSEPDQALKSDMEGITPGEAELLRNTVILKNEVEKPLGLARKIAEKSMSYEEFKTWGENLGFFKKSKSPAEDVTRSTAEESQKLAPIALPDPNPILADVKCQHLLRPGSYVMILGVKGAGKTQVALSCCRSLLTHVSLWGCFPTGSVDANSVCYVDAETPYDEYIENLKQHGLDNCPGFFGLSRFSPELPEFCSIFSLRDENFREGLYSYLLKNKCRYVFLDNLTALMGDEVQQARAAQIVLEWIEQLQKTGICVVLVHHKSEADHAPHSSKARGSQLFTIRARTIIELMGKNEIQTNKLGPDEIQKSVLREGLTVGIRFNPCKPAPILDGKTFWAHLPLGGAEWESLGTTGSDGTSIIDFPFPKPLPATEKAHSVPADGISPEKRKVRSPDQLRVVEILKEKDAAKSADIKEATGWGENKVLDCLNSLIKLDVISKRGKGKATYYTLKNSA